MRAIYTNIKDLIRNIGHFNAPKTKDINAIKLLETFFQLSYDICRDLCKVILTSAYGLLIIGPLGIIRGPVMIDSLIRYVLVLGPLGRLSQLVKIAINYRLGHTDKTINQALGLITLLEKQIANASDTANTRRQLNKLKKQKLVLKNLYTLLIRIQLYFGRLDDAMHVLIRCHKALKVDHLDCLPTLDIKSAHLVKASLAASKLMDSHGLTTLLIKTDPQIGPSPLPHGKKSQKSAAETKNSKPRSKQGNVIKFPRNANKHTDHLH